MSSLHGVSSAPPSGSSSFHTRVGTAPLKSKPTKANGFPIPGVQSPTAAMVMTKDYFVDQDKWGTILDAGEYDYIVVGSGCTALAFIDETLAQDPHKRILCLERGDFWLPSHFQNLPLPFKTVLGGPSETFPWTLSKKTCKEAELGYCHGSCPFFGGRSTFWSAWCPQPRLEDMRNFPKSMIDATKNPLFWRRAKELLHVTGADHIGDEIYRKLQAEIDARLKAYISRIQTAKYTEPAQLAVGKGSPTSTLKFNKFSTPAPLLKIYENQKNKAANGEGARLDILLNCTVQRLGGINDDVVHTIETSRGTFSWQDETTKVILCAGAFPAATILMNSFPRSRKTVGDRVAGHFLTHIVARVPIKNFRYWAPVVPDPDSDQKTKLEIAASYLAGEGKNGQQYHVQITAIHSPNPKDDAEDAARECPDYAAAATEEQLKDSTKHVVFVCATLGEFTEDNDNNFFRYDPNNPDVTTNAILQYTLAPSDRELWDTMDEATYQTIEQMCTPTNAGFTADGDSRPSRDIEYWSTDPDGTDGYWSKERPSVKDIRIPGVVHETSTAFMGPENGRGSVDKNYSPHGITNVHVTGAAVFPTAGSWNPTLTMCGFAQHLARELTPKPEGSMY